MRHIANLVLGEGVNAFSQALFKYIAQYGEEEALLYMQTFLVGIGETGISVTPLVRKNPTGEFCSVLDNLFDCRRGDTLTCADDEELKLFFDKLYKQTVTIQRTGESTSLTINLFLPLYDRGAWQTAQHVITAVNGLSRHFTIDVMGLSRDLLGIYSIPTSTPSEAEMALQERTAVEAVVKMEYQENRLLHRFLYMQNCNRQGVSLNLDTTALARVLGEFALLTEERYDAVFPVTDLEITSVTTFGLSVVWLDKYYYLYYMLRRSYIHILERERVNQTEVDVAKVMPIAQQRLKGRVNIFTDFYQKEVMPRLKKGTGHTKTLTEVSPQLAEQIEKLTTRFTDFLLDNALSLPEKKAALACLIGLDDELIEGYTLMGEELTLDDCGNDALRFFVDQNNRLVHVATDSDGNPVKDGNGKPVYVGGVLADCVDEMGQVNIPLQTLKELRSAMKDSATYIRNKEEEMQRICLEQHEQRNRGKRLTNEGFVLDGQLYRLMDHVEEHPLEETYVPHKVDVNSVDLREFFMPVGQQGSVGACATFAMIGIFEYMLKRAGVETQLSPAFVFYNCAHRDGDGHLLDNGCSHYDVITAMEQKGVCTESVYPYDIETILSATPTDEAFDDAKKRKVLKAMNVELSHQAITSALTDGFPVAMILRVFDSFADNKNGFVYSPTEQELAEAEKSLHSMVICGFSEEDKVYIVRNSWGKAFGDNGYCYIPFSYVENSELCSSLVVITEVSGVEKKIGGDKDMITSVKFDMMDSSIQYSILRILVDEQKLQLRSMQERYRRLRHAYLKLNQSVCIPANRKRINEGAQQRMKHELNNLKERRRKFVEEERTEELRSMQKEGNAMKWRMGLTLLAFLVALSITFYCQRFAEWLDSNFNQICIVSSSVVALALILYWWWWDHKSKKRKIELDDQAADLQQRISRKEAELDELVLKSHVAGMVADQVSAMRGEIQHKYNLLSSFVSNLATWLAEERAEVQKMKLHSQQPFITILDNDTLDRYLSSHIDELTHDIHLHDFFQQYGLDEKSIEEFKKVGIKQVLMSKIEQSLQDFSVFRYLEQPDAFAYLSGGKKIDETLFAQLTQRSECFAQTQKFDVFGDNGPMQILFVHTGYQNETGRWQAFYPTFFQLRPSTASILSPYKLVMLQMQKNEMNELLSLRNEKTTYP